ncbi:MAG: proline--tRNA ligase [Planctomycetes bacterium]|nr:proline--tRNA ligase [Planctomycetota bacterium]
MAEKKITKRSEDYSRWYTDIVQRAQLADYAPVKGCMVMRPYGFAIWERLKEALDKMFKETGHSNAYFPLFIPESFMRKEAEHVEGFAPECAVVTHGGGSKLEEPLYIRPTSETIIWSMYGKWIQSYRDLPLLINQWANIVRWEKRTRLFLRTTEFLWQEGHTAHATEQEAMEEVRRMLDVYRRFAEDHMAMPVIQGKKTESEKFAGAVDTYCIEAMMQDKRALQAGTSHFLGQNFAKAFDVQFQDEEGRLQYVYATSWGVSWRLIGGLIMTHSDDQGLVLPPQMAPIQVVIVPIWKKNDDKAKILEAANQLKEDIATVATVKLDDSEGVSPGFKFNEWEMRGVPLRIELGPRDLAGRQVVFARRDTGDKSPAPMDAAAEQTKVMLEQIQTSLYDIAKTFREDNTREIDAYGDFKSFMENGGFASCHWCGSAECEAKLKEETKATIRCIPLERRRETGACLLCGKPSDGRVVMAKAY